MATISAGDIAITTGFDTEFRDTWVVEPYASSTKNTDYKRPLYWRQDTAGVSNTAALNNPISDRYGIQGNLGVCLPFHNNPTVAPINPINHIGQITTHLAYDFTEIDDEATINSITFKITVKQPNGGNSSPPYPYAYTPAEAYVFDGTYYGAIQVGFTHNGLTSLLSDRAQLTDGDWNTYTITLDRTALTSNSNILNTTTNNSPSELGGIPRFVVKFFGVYDPDITAVNAYGVYEVSNIEVNINYTGRTLFTTGFLRQDVSGLIPDNSFYRHSHILTEAAYAPYGYSYRTAGGTTINSDYYLHYNKEIDTYNNEATDLLNGHIDNTVSREGGGFYQQAAWVQASSSQDLLLFGTSYMTDHKSGTGSRTDVLDMADIRDTGNYVAVTHYNYTGTPSYQQLSNLRPKINIGYLPALGGEGLDMSSEVSMTTTPTQQHNMTVDEMDTISSAFSTTQLGGFLLTSASDNFSTNIDLTNTGLAGIVFAGESDLDLDFDTTFSALLATTAESDLAISFSTEVSANNSIVPLNIPTYSSQIDLDNTGLAGRIRSGFTIDPRSAFQVDDIPDNQTILLQQPNTSQVFTTTGYTRTLLIPIQGENRSHERHIYIDQQTRVLKIPIQGEDRAHERVVYVEQRSSREIKAEQLEE